MFVRPMDTIASAVPGADRIDMSTFVSGYALEEQVQGWLNLVLELKNPAQMPAVMKTLEAAKEHTNRALWGLHYIHSARFLPTRDGRYLQQAESMMATITDPQVCYWVLYARATMAYAVDAAAMPGAVAGLAEFSHQTGAPWMLNGTRQRQANLCLRLGDYMGARHAFRDSYTMAVAAGSPLDEGAAGAGIIEASLSGADAIPTVECHEILTRLHDTRNWANLEWAVETIGNYLANAGQLEQAAVILGYLDKNVPPWPGMAVDQRGQTRRVVEADERAATWLARGATLNRDEFVTYALAQLPTE